MVKQIIKHGLLLFLLIIMQLSFVSHLIWPLSALNIIIVFLVFINMFGSFHLAVTYSMIIGFMIDLHSPFFFMANSLGLIITVFFINKIITRFFTNKSFYSIVFLVALSSALFHYIYNLIFFLHLIINSKVLELSVIFSVADLGVLGWQLATNCLLSAILFLFYYSITNKFQPVLVKK